MKQNKETLKQFFETGDKPTQQQYSDLIDSYIDAKQPEGEANRRFVIDETGEVSVASEQQVPEYTLSPISGTNTVDLLKDGVSVSQIDLTPYLDNTNLARLVSGTVDVNGLATFTRGDNSTFTVDLSNLKDTVPQYQAGTNISIDETDPQNPIINVNGGNSILVTEGDFTPTFKVNGSSFTAFDWDANYYSIEDRFFVDIRLLEVTSNGAASNGEIEVSLDGINPGKGAKYTAVVSVYNGNTRESYNTYMPSGDNIIYIKDEVLASENLYISVNYRQDTNPIIA
ncbi:hypothetical protein ACIVBQ_001367 [Tenacibaculum discolor]